MATARRDAVVAGGLLLLAAVAIQQAARLPFGSVRNPGPGFLPWWTSVIVAVLSVVLLGQVLIRPPAGAEPWGRVAKGGARVVGLAAYTLALEPAGYPICTFLLVLFMLRVIDRVGWPLALALAGLASGGCYVVFAIWLQVPLPAGPLAR